MREYNYNKNEVVIETKRTEKGETYKVFYENKKYFFGLFSEKGDKILDGIVLHYYISDDSDEHWRTTIKDGIRTKQETWINGEKVEEITYNKEGVFSIQKKKTTSDDKNSDLFNSMNKEFGTDFKQSDYTIPIELLEKIDDLIYLENKLYSGFVTIETFDMGKPKKIMEFKKGVQEGRFKEYYENGQIKIDSNILNDQLNGENKEYYENGELMVEGSFKEGENEGLWKGYYENGKKKIEEEYKDGVNHGFYKKYYENGNLYQETTLVNGEIDGLYIEYKEDGSINKKTLFKNGEVIIDYPEVDFINESKKDVCNEKNLKGELQRTFHEGTENIESEYYIVNGKRNGPMKVFYKSGQLRTEMSFKNDLPDGKGKGYFENGKISTVNSFKLGKEHGEFISYHENGQLYTKYNFVDGLEDGRQENWYENGQLDIEKTMKNGKLNGWSRNYFNNGQIEFEGEYSEGEPIGSHKTWNEYGKLIDEIKYSNVFKGLPEDFEKIVSGTFSNSSEKNESKEEVERIDFNEIESEPNNGDILYLLNGKLFSGILYTKYDNGNLMSEFEIKKGRQFGTQRMYEKNGDLRYENYIDKYTEVI